MNAKPDPGMREGQPDAVLMQLCEPSTRVITQRVIEETVFIYLIVPDG